MLQQVANRTQLVIGEQGVAARLGGDEFIVLLDKCSTDKEIREVIHKLQKALLEKIEIRKNSIAITSSIGQRFVQRNLRVKPIILKMQIYGFMR